MKRRYRASKKEDSTVEEEERSTERGQRTSTPEQQIFGLLAAFKMASIQSVTSRLFNRATIQKANLRPVRTFNNVPPRDGWNYTKITTHITCINFEKQLAKKLLKFSKRRSKPSSKLANLTQFRCKCGSAEPLPRKTAEHVSSCLGRFTTK